MAISISIQEKDDNCVDSLISGLTKLFENADAVKELSKDTYLSSWVFGTMIKVCSVDPQFLTKYLDWV